MDKNKTFAQIEQEYDQMAQTIKDMQRTAVRPVMTGCVRRFSVPCGVFGTPIVKHLNDWSWQDISEIAASGLAPAFFQVGDIKTVTLKDGSTIELRIIGFNHDQDPDGRILPISFETVQTLNKDFSMNEDRTNVGGWAESKLRRVLNSEVLNLLPDDLLAVIKPCVKVTSKGGTMTQTTDKLFILSEQEIFGRKIYSIGGEGQWYDWYRRENTPYGKKKQSGERDWRWERSPFGNNPTYFCYVSSTGTAILNGAINTRGVAFGFCV